MFQNYEQRSQWRCIKPILASNLKLVSQLLGRITIVNEEFVRKSFASGIENDFINPIFWNNFFKVQFLVSSLKIMDW